ncbi:MAG: hypothetical protein IIX61_07585 [Loktanella sp.]|nr:hypothetical protein [Loktanella sp.]
MARKPIPLPVPFEEPETPDCPRCPKKGSPAWMATFADIATLLMAFFVLILSFADFNVPKFKMVAGSLERAFGVQREINVVEQPKGTTILELNFSPAPEVSLTERMTQDTTDTVQPELKQPTADDFNADPAETAKADALNSLIDALHDGALAVELAEDPAAALSDQLQMLADGLDALAMASDDPLIAGLADQLDQMAAAAQTQQDASTDQIAEGVAQRSAALAEAELRVA